MPDRLLVQAKKAALENNITLTEVITNALRESLSKRKKKTPKKEFRLITYGKGGAHPGVDLDDTSALVDLMDGVDAAHRR